MGKLVDAEITLKYSNGQLTIASTPNTHPRSSRPL